ncbi:MAG: ferrous iron transport protein A [Clostridia bacterium]|nr:ferrous iron transport protein A [Clostridia bacterium]
MRRALNRLKIGESAYVVQVKTEEPLRCRLLDLGFTPGTKVTLQRMAPLGDPLEVNMRGYLLTLNRRDAAAIMVQRSKPR